MCAHTGMGTANLSGKGASRTSVWHGGSTVGNLVGYLYLFFQDKICCQRRFLFCIMPCCEHLTSSQLRARVEKLTAKKNQTPNTHQKITTLYDPADRFPLKYCVISMWIMDILLFLSWQTSKFRAIKLFCSEVLIIFQQKENLKQL